ncbi:MAG: hypothetical protein ACRENJ_05315 [Candidatus Eiseniibacteriota bacterium]
MQRLARLTLIFAVAFAVLIVTPAFLGGPFAPYPLMSMGDVLDLLTPLVLIPLYWLLFQIRPDRPPSPRETLLFLVLAALWTEGQGMHLVGNSVGRLVQALADGPVVSLVHFYDEVLSHYLWHFGLVGLSALLIYRQWNAPFEGQRSGLVLEIVAGTLHGFNYFVTFVEAQTTLLGVPFAAGVVGFAAIFGRSRLRQQPILAFFFVTCLVASLCFLGWGLYWRGLPEFSEVGIIR